jgi:hypothetical protein|nr:MAG TPA: hypothetical protein [Caudoviricetes sp.]
MAKKKEELQNPEEQATFTKDQFMGSEKYRYKQDVIEVLLDVDRSYSIEEVDLMITEYMEREAR